MKPFNAWISSMAGKIPDASEISNKKDVVIQTTLQIRAALATLLIGEPECPYDVQAWLRVCAVVVTPGSRTLSYSTCEILGDEETGKYCYAEDEVAWWKELDIKIKQGWMPQDTCSDMDE